MITTVTEDESSESTIMTKNKRQFIQYCYVSNPCAKEFKTIPSAQKVMFSIFGDNEENDLYTTKLRLQEIDNYFKRYCEILQAKHSCHMKQSET